MKMEMAKKWTVTYTKQINKKAKVYHDGFLELNSVRRKVILYDDCQSILDSRFVKKDDLIESGETLKMDSYLVDIGHLHGDVKPSASVFIVPPTRESVARTPESFQSPISDSNTILGKQKAGSRKLSPSHKIIREFKMSEISKRSYSPASSGTTQSSKREFQSEWQVLYTTQITQKAKKYQDGYLQLLICGSKGNQVFLYDATRRLLESRFLKNDEVIRSGEFVAFDGHLVDIGECKEDHEPPKKLNCQGMELKIKVEADDDHIYSPKEYPVEWEAMYTTELTKKTKKYNSGTLKLVASGSYHNQVTLLSEEGTMLSRRFLVSSEKLRVGSTLRVQNYLVELGDSRASPKDFQNTGPPMIVKNSSVRCSNIENTKSSIGFPTNGPARGEFQNTGPSLMVKDSSVRCSNAENTKSSMGVPTNGPARGALEILSILRKPMTQKNLPQIERQIQDGFYASQPSRSYQSTVGNHIEPECEQGFFYEGSAKAGLHEENTEMPYQDNTSTKSEAVNEVPFVEISKKEKGQTGSSDFSVGSGCISKSGTGIDSVTSSSLSGVEPVLAELVKQETPPMLEVSSTEAKQMEVCSEQISRADGGQIDARWARGINVIDMPTSNEQNTNTKVEDGFPCFDLGF